MFWVMTRLFPFRQLHLATSNLSPFAQGRVSFPHQIPLFDASPIFGVSDFAAAPARTPPPPNSHLLVGLKINLGFTTFYFQKTAL